VIARAIRLAQATSSTTSVVLLVLFNLVPLAGVLLWGWSVGTILVLYWVENGIVGALNIPKMLLASGADDGTAATARPSGFAMAGKVGRVGFFLVHYGIFWLVHGIFVWTLPFVAGPLAMDPVGPVLPGGGLFPDGGGGLPGSGPFPDGGPLPGTPTRPVGPDLTAVAWGAVGLGISHVASFVINFLGRHEYRKVSTAAQMFAPYGRLVILHVTIIIGAMVSLALGSPVGAIVVLVILKTAVDLTFHVREHDRLAGAPSSPTVGGRPVQPLSGRGSAG
jgi:hypothetical protein